MTWEPPDRIRLSRVGLAILLSQEGRRMPRKDDVVYARVDNLRREEDERQRRIDMIRKLAK